MMSYLRIFGGSVFGAIFLWILYVLNLWLDFIPKYEPYDPDRYRYGTYDSSDSTSKVVDLGPESPFDPANGPDKLGPGIPGTSAGNSNGLPGDKEAEYQDLLSGGSAQPLDEPAPDAPTVDLARIREHLDSLSSEIQTNAAGQIVSVTIRGLVFNGDLEMIGQLASLESLDLQNAAYIDDEGLRHLSRLSRLRSLTLKGSGITDAGLSHLRPLSALREVNVEGSRVTVLGVMQLRESMPQCNVIFGPL